MSKCVLDPELPFRESCYVLIPCGVFICFLTLGLPLPVISLFVHDELGLNNTLVGLAVGIQFMATVCTREYAGRASDTKGAKRTTMLGMLTCAGTGIFYIAAALLPVSVWLRFGILIVGRLMLGCGESMVITGSLAWGFGLMGSHRSGKVMSWTGMAVYGALAFGAPLGLMQYHQWGFVSLGVSTLLLPFLALAMVMRFPSTKPQTGNRPSLVKVLGMIWLPGMALALQGVGFAVIGAFATLYFNAQNWGNAGLALTCFGGAFVLARVLFGSLPDKKGGVAVSLVSLAVECVGQVLLWTAPHPALALCGAFLTGAGCSLIFPAMGVEVVRVVPANVRGTAIGGFAAFQDIAYAASGPITGAFTALFGLSSVFFIGALCALAGICVTLIFQRVARKERSASE